MKQFDFLDKYLRIFFLLFLAVFVGQGFLLCDAGDQAYYTSDEGTDLSPSDYYTVDCDLQERTIRGISGVSGKTTLQNTPLGGYGIIDVAFGWGCYDIQMYNSSDELPRGLKLRSDFDIYGDIEGPGIFSSDTSDLVTIFFHKDDAISFLDGSYGLTFGAGDYALDFMGHKFSCVANNVLMHDSSNEVFLTIKNAIFEKSTADWINLSAGSNYTLTFENVVFNSDPYSGEFDNAGNNSLCFKGLNNQFNAGLTLPVDIKMGTKKQFSGVLDLNGYTFTLESDIAFAKSGSLTGVGVIETDGHDRALYFVSDQALSGQITIKDSGGGESLTINGGGKVFDWTNGLDVSNGRLILENIKLQNFAGNVFGQENIMFGQKVLLIS